MQITGNQNGFSFFSAYKLAAAPKPPSPNTSEEKVGASTDESVAEMRRSEDASDTHREGLLLQSAHRTAARAAEWTEALAEL
jgi:hypothetical protein